MIEAGSVLEDSIYHNAMLKGSPGSFNESLHAGDGRFNNHFYAVQFNSRAYCRVYSSIMPTILAKMLGMYNDDNLADYMKTEKTLCLGLKQRTDNIDWVFNEDVNLGEGRVNEYGLEDAFAYFKKSFDGNETERKKYQAKFFVTLGFMSHMLQDLHSPAHVRDGAHALGDYLEIYGRYEKGFNLKGGKFNPANEPEITAAIRSFNMTSYLSGMNFKSLEDFYYKEASWVSHNFFSEEHNSFEAGNTETGAGIAINNDGDRDTIFDLYNDHLSSSETHEEDASEQWNYIKTDGKVGEVYGPIKEGHDTVAFIEKGWFFRDEHMLVPTEYTIKRNAVNEPIGLEPVNQYKTANTTALKDTAINVIPRAVASTQAFLNFFFRGQIAVRPASRKNKTLKITNESNTSLVSHDSLLTFKAGGLLHVYYFDENISKPVYVDDEGEEVPYTLENDLPVGASVGINIGAAYFQESTKIGKATKFAVIYEGNIGEELGGNNNYGYGMKGVSATVSNRFERVNDKNVTIDYAHSRVWQDNNASERQDDLGNTRMYWNEAKQYCANLELGEYDNWVLPRLDEIFSIVQPSSDTLIYDKFFLNLEEKGYWTSDVEYINSQLKAKIYNFRSGRVTSLNTTSLGSKMNVMCIRHGVL